MNLFGNKYRVGAFALPLVLLSLPSLAEEVGGSDMPQLNISLFPEQVFWLAVTFTVLYFLMSVIALPRVARTQENRRNVIAAEVEAARLANDKAMEMVAASDKSLKEARAKAQESVSVMIAKVGDEAAAHQATQERELLRIMHRAEADIAVAREAALNDMRAGAADLAKEIVAKILHSGERVRA